MNSYRNDNRRPVHKAPSASARRRRRKKQKRQQMIMLACFAALIIALIIVIISISTGGKKDKTAETAVQAVETTIPQPTETPVPQPTATVSPYEALAANPKVPAAAEGYLPVFRSANTNEKVVAITIDDCYQSDNFRKIVDIALQHNAIFGQLDSLIVARV